MAAKKLTKVRPGHADLTGMLKYRQEDARAILERASARETAIRVAAGEVYRQYLSALGVEIGGYVCEICGVKDESKYAFNELARAKTTQTGMLNAQAETQAIEKISALKKAGDTAGGAVEIRVKGLKSGFGSVMTYTTKLDAQLAGALMSIQAVKGVEIGAGFEVATKSGKEIHDEIFYDAARGFYRTTNRAGGIEGGMSNGEELVLRAAMKPIPTLMNGLRTVEYSTKESAVAASERSDVCAIFALEVIAEGVIPEVLANAVAARLGGDTMQEVMERYQKLP
jgi:chorismate synthase